jgi:tetratricopeptide (TPR) repeat protein
MNTTTTILLSLLVGASAAAGVTVVMQPTETSTDSLAIRALEASLEKLQAANQDMAQQLQALAQRPASAVAPVAVDRSAAPTVTAEQVAVAVEAYLKTRQGGVVDGLGIDGAGNAANASFDLAKDLDGLIGTSYFENTEAWKRAFAAGKMDEVVAEIEALAKANPNDPQAQMNLASAYMAYLQMDNTKWDMSMKADKQFDKVLELDNNHWEARFTKAVSYTFWPAFLGKGKDAISHFETLVKQQESMPVQDSQAQTYLYLGNMLADREPERAREIWQKGMARHPGNAELRQKLGN